MSTRLKDVAEAAGVSTRTVSNVVSGAVNVSPATRTRVQTVLDEMGYRPNLAARQLRQGRTGMIALVIPDLAVPYFAELARHILGAAKEEGLTVLIDQTDGDLDREMVFVRGAASTSVDGVIMSPLTAALGDLPPTAELPPLVLLGERVIDPRFDHVAIDNLSAARAATRHLAALGRRRIAAIGVDSPPTSAMANLRLRGYLEVVDAEGLATDQRLVVSTRWFNRSDGYEATKSLLTSGAEPDGIFCFTDLLAHGALRALADVGIRVPDDVAVVGIDDAEESSYSSPSLTSIAPDKAEIARRAVQCLVQRIRGEHREGHRDDSPAFILRVRESAPRPGDE